MLFRLQRYKLFPEYTKVFAKILHRGCKGEWKGVKGRSLRGVKGRKGEWKGVKREVKGSKGEWKGVKGQ